MAQIKAPRVYKNNCRTHSRGYSANRFTVGTVKPRAGWLELGGRKFYFRSRWEANYARFLEWLKSKKIILDWEYELETFWFEGIRRGCVSYKPDFKLYNLDKTSEYHEVKGWLDPKSKTKIKRMAKYYPDIKLILINKKTYRDLEKRVAKLIPGWELTTSV